MSYICIECGKEFDPIVGWEEVETCQECSTREKHYTGWNTIIFRKSIKKQAIFARLNDKKTEKLLRKISRRGYTLIFYKREEE